MDNRKEIEAAIRKALEEYEIKLTFHPAVKKEWNTQKPFFTVKILAPTEWEWDDVNPGLYFLQKKYPVSIDCYSDDGNFDVIVESW